MYNTKLNILLFVCVAFLTVQACKKGNKQPQAVPPVNVVEYTVQPKHVTFYDTYPGTVVALEEVEIRSQVSGFITGIFFTEGSRVKKGDKLYEIDRTKYQASYQQAKASVDIAETNLQKAQRDADRYTKLNEQNAIAKQTFDDATTNLQNVKMQLMSAKASLANAETDFKYSVLKAPFSGTIGFSLVKPGAFINSGQTLLNTISSDDPIAVDFIVNEKALPGFISLMKNRDNTADSTFKILLPDNSEYKSSGRISVIDRAVDPQTGTIKIRLTFPNSDRSLVTGMNCKVKVLSGTSGDQLVIPFKSVVEQMGEYFVYAIDSSKVKQIKIQPGSNLGEYIVVTKGVKPGDKIVLEGIQKVHEGSIVQTGNMEGQQPQDPAKTKQNKKL